MSEEVKLLREIQEKISELLEITDTPALFQCYKTAEMNIHWALWVQGEDVEIMPELENKGSQVFEIG
ncbi:hypothetical protein CVD28_05325 [Bacillus sp. M6-12]|uniref:hypothetical protein n=1 Tax=Bacillus sp. M6-12 TaxID=2054166 RepID=UPI000C776ED0|nr:hypothetical protein [Bacillus sp. M6-12]PLS18560.1 hypothetical protein CVD28_05325 [Bacillus sp. M6-12]